MNSRVYSTKSNRQERSCIYAYVRFSHRSPSRKKTLHFFELWWVFITFSPCNMLWISHMGMCMQQEQEMRQIQNQLKVAERRAQAAEDRAAESQTKVQAWQNQQADAVRTLSIGWSATGRSLDPSIDASLPRNESLQLQQQPESLAASIKQSKQGSSPTNPVQIFRQVYRDRPGKQEMPLCAQYNVAGTISSQCVPISPSAIGWFYMPSPATQPCFCITEHLTCRGSQSFLQ